MIKIQNQYFEKLFILNILNCKLFFIESLEYTLIKKTRKKFHNIGEFSRRGNWKKLKI